MCYRAIACAFLIIFLALINPSAHSQDIKEEVSALFGDLESLVNESPTVRIILDPGHGGSDLGARSSKHILEKNVTLKLARLIQDMLSRNETLEALTSRTGDSEIPVLERIKFANFSQGDLFVSLHTDGGMGPRAHSIKVFICRRPKDNGKHDTWEKQNFSFKGENEKLARTIAQNLIELKTGREVDIIRSDKLMLGGLAMPAVIVEAIDLSNPEDEIRIENEIYINRVAEAIASGVVDYLIESEKL